MHEEQRPFDKIQKRGVDWKMERMIFLGGMLVRNQKLSMSMSSQTPVSAIVLCNAA